MNVGKNKIFHYSLEYNAKPTIILQSKKKKFSIFHTRDRRVKGLKLKFERENDGKSQQGTSKIKLKWDLTSEFFVFFVSLDLRKLTTISIAFRANGRQFEFLGHNSTTWLLLCMTTIKTYGGKRRILPNNTPTHLFFVEIHRNSDRDETAQ